MTSCETWFLLPFVHVTRESGRTGKQRSKEIRQITERGTERVWNKIKMEIEKEEDRGDIEEGERRSMNGAELKRKEDRMGNGERDRKDEKGALEVSDEGFFSLSALSPPVVHCRTLPPYPPSSHLSDRQLLADSFCCCSLRPHSPRFSPSPRFLHFLFQICFYASRLSSRPWPLSSVWKNMTFPRVKKGPPPGYMRTSVTSACNQSLFGLLRSLLAMRLCLPPIQTVSRIRSSARADHLLELGRALLSASGRLDCMLLHEWSIALNLALSNPTFWTGFCTLLHLLLLRVHLLLSLVQLPHMHILFFCSYLIYFLSSLLCLCG